MRATGQCVLLSACVVACAGAKAPKPPQDKIKNVVLLMEENRSFDHMCGFFRGVDGLTGREFNLMNTSDPRSRRFYVNNTSPYVGPFDPNHSVPPTTDKLFGVLNGRQPSAEAVPDMSGFVQFEAQHHPDPSSVMNMFKPEDLPIMHSLYQEFNLFDKYYCSVPGPTWPNRLFQILGTSKGDTSTSHWDKHGVLYSGRTIFDMFADEGYDWKFYYADAPLELAMIENLVKHPLHFHTMEAFKRDAREGKLPTFSYVNPRWFVDPLNGKGANDQHPDHNVALGEELMKDMYETLRASPQWNNTLFIITYDEHGGFYDHVPPPSNVPAPDDSKSFPDDFSFNRSGVRIPTLLVSPWLEKGRIIHEPPASASASGDVRHYELTSVIATMRDLFGLKGNLTRRDAWAASFADVFTRDTPRTDCPTRLPPAPRVAADYYKREMQLPLNDLQRDIVRALARLRGSDAELSQADALPQLQGEAKAWADKIVKEILSGSHIYGGDEDEEGTHA